MTIHEIYDYAGRFWRATGYDPEARVCRLADVERAVAADPHLEKLYAEATDAELDAVDGAHQCDVEDMESARRMVEAAWRDDD